MSKKTEKRSVWGFWLGAALGVLIGGAAVFAISYFQVRKNQPYQPIEEAKICHANLKMDRERPFLTLQTREYLKARLYANAADYINRGWLVGWEWDYGPVDEDALGGIYAIKNAAPLESV